MLKFYSFIFLSVIMVTTLLKNELPKCSNIAIVDDYKTSRTNNKIETIKESEPDSNTKIKLFYEIVCKQNYSRISMSGKPIYLYDGAIKIPNYDTIMKLVKNDSLFSIFHHGKKIGLLKGVEINPYHEIDLFGIMNLGDGFTNWFLNRKKSSVMGSLLIATTDTTINDQFFFEPVKNNDNLNSLKTKVKSFFTNLEHFQNNIDSIVINNLGKLILSNQSGNYFTGNCMIYFSKNNMSYNYDYFFIYDEPNNEFLWDFQSCIDLFDVDGDKFPEVIKRRLGYEEEHIVILKKDNSRWIKIYEQSI